MVDPKKNPMAKVSAATSTTPMTMPIISIDMDRPSCFYKSSTGSALGYI
jgi:hypothetical protein